MPRGLGPDGTHSYLDNHEAAQQLLDGALAAAALEPAGLVGDPVGAAGYSQGGGTVLSTQALEHAITGKHTLEGVAAIAPEWPISTRSFGYEDVLRNPSRFTGLAGLAPPTVTVLRHYGFLINRMGMTGEESFPEDEASSIVSSINSLCTVPLGGALCAQQPKLEDPSPNVCPGACVHRRHAGCTGPVTTTGCSPMSCRPTRRRTRADHAGTRRSRCRPLARPRATSTSSRGGRQPGTCSDSPRARHRPERRARRHWVERSPPVTPPTCSSTTLPSCNR
jgi:hypothetical protein